MRVLLTGGAGFIGRHVTDELVAKQHDVRVLDSLRADVHAGRPWQPPAGVQLTVGDVRDDTAVDQALAGVDVVLHLAAKVGLGVSVADLPDYASSNDAGTAHLLAGMARAGTPALVLASSMVVYGEGLGRCSEHGDVTPAPRRESALVQGDFEARCPVCDRTVGTVLVSEGGPIDPRNAYASSKYAQELYTGNWARVTGGSAAILRYHNVYGPGMPRNTPYAGVAAIFLSALRSGRVPQVYEDGGQRRDFIHVRDIAAATVRAGERHRAGVRAFNLGSGQVRTVGDMARALATAVHGPTPAITGEFRLGDVRHITADSARIVKELDWTAQVDFAGGMAELAAEQDSAGER